ncbi:MAG: hypothetical protein ABIO40_02100 [Devosia sp.]
MDSETQHETPSQGLFIGYLAAVLLALAVVIAALGIITGMTHPPVL